MKTETINRFRGNLTFSAAFVVISLLVVSVPYFLLLGWNLITLLLFWFILVPFISILSSRFYNKINKNWIAAITGCIIFYLFMVFMIYSHYKTDFFKVMMISSVSSIFIISLSGLNVAGKRQYQIE